jgi:hypothetical protein
MSEDKSTEEVIENIKDTLRLRQNNRPYGYRGLKIFTSLKLRFQDFQRKYQK